MKQMRKTFILFVLLASASMVRAQSLDYIKSLIAQGEYLNAAKMLRPLAESGNAEAQCMAAELFFEGKGVNKDDNQGIKYATLSANQGNKDAAILLFNYYDYKHDYQRAFSVFNEFKTKNSNMQHDSLINFGLGWYYINGYGIEKDEDTGWKLIYKYAPRKQFQKIKKEFNDYIGRFFSNQANQSREISLEYYADYLYSNKLAKEKISPYSYYTLREYILNVVYGSEQVLQEKSDSGIPWAMANWGNRLWLKGQQTAAIAQCKKAADAGSAYGSFLYGYYKESAWKTKKANIKVVTGQLLTASLLSTQWESGTLKLMLRVSTPMPTCNLTLGTVSARSVDGDPVRYCRVRLTGLKKQPGYNYYKITRNDSAILTVSIPGMSSKGELNEVTVILDMSGTKSYVKVQNLVWE